MSKNEKPVRSIDPQTDSSIQDGSASPDGNTIIYELLENARQDLPEERTTTIPIRELTSLGTGISALVSQLRTVIQTVNINTNDLLSIANAGEGAALEVAKDGNFWEAMKTDAEKSKMAIVASAGSLSASTIMPINLATIMMAAALFEINKKLKDIANTERQIQEFQFRETKEKSGIDADTETLSSVLQRYKFNWDNERFIANNHKLIIDIQRNAQKNMISCEKSFNDLISQRNQSFDVIDQHKVIMKLDEFQDKFRYYRQSFYNYYFAIMLEVMLSGNFSEQNIAKRRRELGDDVLHYWSLFSNSIFYLTRLKKSVETNVIKDAEDAVSTVRDFIFQFGEMNDPQTYAFKDNLDTMIKIFDRTSQICIDQNNVYLISIQKV